MSSPDRARAADALWLFAVVVQVPVLAVLIAALWTGDVPARAGGPGSVDTQQPPAAGLASGAGSSAIAETAAVRELAAARTSATCVVYGRFVDQAGLPVSEGYVRFSDLATGFEVSADGKSGLYAAAGLPAGRLRAVAKAEGYQRLEETVDLTEASGECRHDFVMRPATTLAVHVQTPDGEPFETVVRGLIEQRQLRHDVELHAIAVTEALPASLPLSTSGSSWGIGVGDFTSRWSYRKETGEPADLIGRLELQVDPPVHVALMLRQQVLSQQVVAPGTTDVVFQLALDDVRGRFGSIRFSLVSAATQLPLSGADVQLRDARSGGVIGAPPHGSEVELAGVSPGEWQLEVTVKGYEAWDQLVRVGPSEDVDLGTLALHESMAVTGSVVDGDGRPVPATVRWDALDRHSYPQQLRGNRGTPDSAEGEFSLFLGRGRYALHAWSLDRTRVAHAVIDTTGGAPADLRLQLEPTVVVVVENRVEPLAPCMVRIHDRNRVPVFGEEVRSTGDLAWRLPRGEYVVDVYRDAQLVRSFPLRVTGPGVRCSVP